MDTQKAESKSLRAAEAIESIRRDGYVILENLLSVPEVAALRDDDARERIAVAARRLGRPHAASVVAGSLLELADSAA